jgi:hypothetical protein
MSTLAAGEALPMDAVSELQERGFIVIAGPVPPDRLDPLINAYTASVAAAIGDDIKIGSTSTRVSDFVNRGSEFDELYVFPPLLEACRRVIGRPFKLSSLHARTVRPHMPAQELHVDVPRDSADWPLLGFILMVDEFRPDNGATRFVPGSHQWANTPADSMSDPLTADHTQVLACGDAGSLLVFNGSAWHGHSANTSSAPRRSIQGAFIPREGRAGTDFAARMQPETHARLGPLARHVLALRSVALSDEKAVCFRFDRAGEPHMAADQKPDFSGEYTLNRQASTLTPGGAATVLSAVLRIEHREPVFRCQASFAFEGQAFDFSLERVSDGREVVGQDKEGQTVSTLNWEGNTLLFIDRTTLPDSEVTMSWRYELLEGRLRAVERIRGGGRDQDNIWVFERQ